MLQANFEGMNEMGNSKPISRQDLAYSVNESDRLVLDTKKYLASRIRHAAPDSLLDFAWKQFYTTYSDVIVRFARVRKVPDEELSDFTQDVWLAVIAELPRLKYDPSRGGLRAWLWKVIRNKAAELHRKRFTRATEHLVTPEALAATPDHRGAEPAMFIEREWEQELVHVILKKLRASSDERSYRVFHMRLMEDRTVLDVAKTLQLTPAQVRARHHRLRQKFFALYKVYAGKDFG